MLEDVDDPYQIYEEILRNELIFPNYLKVFHALITFKDKRAKKLIV
jgi:hypothetical protein